jgi:hypothetical protein
MILIFMHDKLLRLILQSRGKFFKIKFFFFSLPGEVFLIKEKKVFMKNLPGDCNINLNNLSCMNINIMWNSYQKD